MNQTETKKIGEFGALNNSVIFFGMIANHPLKCRKYLSLNFFWKDGSLGFGEMEVPHFMGKFVCIGSNE